MPGPVISPYLPVRNSSKAGLVCAIIVMKEMVSKGARYDPIGRDSKICGRDWINSL